MRRAGGSSGAVSSGGFLSVSAHDPAPGRPALSFGTFSAAAPVPCAANTDAAPVVPRAAVPFDPWRFRAVFPDRWSAFCRAHYASPEHVAVAFSVTERTARHWWEGTGGPQGDKVVVALVRHGADFTRAMGLGATGVAA